MSTRLITRTVGVLCWLALTASIVSAATVLERSKLGNHTEDITFVTNGPFARHVIMVDGLEVYGMPRGGPGAVQAKARKLFDLRGVEGFNLTPNGITYLESERLFVFNQATDRGHLYFVDHKGTDMGRRPITYLNGYTPGHVEGMAYIPLNSPIYPDHILMSTIAFDALLESRIQVIRRDGVVVDEIFPDHELLEMYTLGLAFEKPDRIVATDLWNSAIHTLDFDGNLLGSTAPIAGFDTFEGIVQGDRGKHFAASIFQGRLVVYDESLVPMPQSERDFLFGPGLHMPRGVAWDRDMEQFLVNHRSEESIALLSSLTPDFDTATPIHDMAADGFGQSRGMTYLADEQLLAMAHRDGPEALLMCDPTGTIVEQLPFAPWERPLSVSWIPMSGEFVVRFADGPARLHLRTRFGAPVAEMDLAPIGVNSIMTVTFFVDDATGEGRFLVMADQYRAIVTDMFGNPVHEFNYRDELNVLTPGGLTWITSGRYAGALAAIDNHNSEILIFRLD